MPLSPEIARPAFVALATDTGWFRFASTTADTLRLAARLVDAGAAPDQLYKQLYENDSLARLQLIGRALAHTQTELDGRLIHTWLELADFAASRGRALRQRGHHQHDAFGRRHRGGRDPGRAARAAASRSACAAAARSIAAPLAEQFGGGGHKKAAGASLNEPLDSAREKILDAVRAAM